jgi:two-component system, LytTR family, response regulator
MKQYNALIIDDERNIREALVSLLNAYCPEIHVCGSVGSAMEGRKLLENFRIDIILLDISMPKEDGFTFLASIPKEKYGIIFTTAFQEYALRALKANAIDYLLKPVNPHELKDAISKAIYHHSLRNNNPQVQEIYHESLKNLQNHLLSSEKHISRITVTEQFGFRMVNVSDLMFLDADSNYTVLHVAGGSKIVATRNLGEFEKMLDNPQFFRIHKSTLVNVNYLSGFSSYEGNFAELKDGTRLAVSRRKVMEFREWVKNFSIPID